MIVRSIPRDLGRDLALVVGGTAVTAVAAQISIPWQPVPFTLQTVAVLVSGLALGARRGAASQLTYLLAGAAGLPVFAEGKAGAGWLFGMTGGYLWAFILAAALVGYVAEKSWGQRPLVRAASLAGANLILLAIGSLWLSLYVGVDAAWKSGFLLFVGGAMIQSAAAWVLVPAVRKVAP